ncbi:MAG: hypothetical protein ACOYNL_05670, partial [Rickettsiales bacterium]
YIVMLLSCFGISSSYNDTRTMSISLLVIPLTIVLVREVVYRGWVRSPETECGCDEKACQ